MEISELESRGRHEDARWLVHKDGTRIWARWVTEPIRNKEGQVTGLAKVLRDETERLKTEMSLRQSEKLAVVGRMASSIAHEINNPLEAVTNLIYLARRGVVSPEVGEFLEQAELELARVSHITTATLRFHRQTAEPHIVDIEEILESVLVLYEGRLKSMQVEIERRYSLHPSISCQAVEVQAGDRESFEQCDRCDVEEHGRSAAGCAVAEGCGSGDGARGRQGNDCGFGCGNPGVDAEACV